jgi:7-cyano-7-deazaguanine synthase
MDYGQRHKKEIESGKRIAKKAGADFKKVKFALPWSGSSLMDKKSKLPQSRNVAEMVADGIPSTYVPARNTIFLSFALSYADAINADAIIIGANAVDFSGYPDCRPRYIQSMARAAALGTKRGAEHKPIRVLAPLIHMSKSEIVKLARKLRVPLDLTWSCYQGGNIPCGTCDSCILRAKGFDGAGLKDPALREGR